MLGYLREAANAIISSEAMSKITDAPTMTAEAASKTEAATKGRPEPAFRKPNQTRAARQRQQMITDFVTALGGSERVTPLLMRDISRVADLMALCEQERAKALRGEPVSIANLSRLEGSCDRAVRRLRLPVSGTVADRRLPLRERLRGGKG